MIYLIGGPPKCGKTTFAKTFSKLKNISWVSTDSLQSAIKPYVNEEDLNRFFPSSYQRGNSNDEKYSKYSTQEIIDAYRRQAKTLYQAVDMFAVCEILDGNDYIIEGYHIEPELAGGLDIKYPGKTKSIFFIKTDINKFKEDIMKSTTPNDWIISRTKNIETFDKISEMVCQYGRYIENESKKFGHKVFNMDNNFDKQIHEAVEFFGTF